VAAASWAFYILLRQSGNLQTAATTYQQARATAQEIDDKAAIAYVMQGLGDVAVDRGDLAAARKSYKKSLALRKEIGEKQTVAETELALARLSLEEGHAADAETVIRKCKEQFHQDGQADDELAASVTLMQALLGQDKFVEADKEKQTSQALAAKSTNLLNRLQFDLISARVELASGHIESSRTLLERTLQSAQAHHLVGVELETRLTLAERKKKLGQSAGAHADLVALEKVAHDRGFGLIASKAESIRNNGEMRSQ
jgi:eukaryotic-like serine/threonine-protein kinase